MFAFQVGSESGKNIGVTRKSKRTPYIPASPPATLFEILALGPCFHAALFCGLQSYNTYVDC
jgi:hypothetical protein